MIPGPTTEPAVRFVSEKLELFGVAKFAEMNDIDLQDRCTHELFNRMKTGRGELLFQLKVADRPTFFRQKCNDL
jgi:hypothetical protein